MILQFPNLETLQLALTSEVIPQNVSLTPAESVLQEDGSVLIKSAKKLPRSVAAELKRLEVKSLRKFPASQSLKLSCWLQAIELEKAGPNQSPSVEIGDNTTVLFHLPGEENLAGLVTEMLRLGNDRQSFRCLASSGPQPFANQMDQPDACSLLRVVGPPYYSMLRALDRAADSDGSADDLAAASAADISAYVEVHPRVWIQAGYRHPLGARVQPPAGKWLLIKPGHSWLFFEEAPFRDVYKSLEFPIQSSETSWKDRSLDDKIKVPLGLLRSGAGEPAQMWVVHENAIAQIEKIVSQSNNQLLSRLAFAVIESPDSQPCVIIRVRPSKKTPPVLVVDGIQLRPYLGIPNLFVPVGMRVHPPLRRDAVTKLLAGESQRVVWLEPVEQQSDDDSPGEMSLSVNTGLSKTLCGFVPNSVDDAAFRPLTDWVEYVLDHDHEALETWTASHRFDFDSFICIDDVSSQPKKKGGKKPKKTKSDSDSPPTTDMANPEVVELANEPSDVYDVDFSTGEEERVQREPDKLQIELQRVEESFLAADVSLDDPQRVPLWREMGEINAQLEHRHDATVCWSNVVWNTNAAADQATLSKDYRSWLACEIRSSKFKSFSASDLDSYLNEKSSRPLDSSLVVAYLVWAADQAKMPEGLSERLNGSAQFLERQEQYLPIRTAWLAWKAIYKLSGNDTLLLARARDRALQRLFDHGLPAEYDMPSFLRAQGVAQTERFRVLLDHVVDLKAKISAWIEEPVAGSDPKTKVYADLMFAYGLARLGETSNAKASVVGAVEALTAKDPIHNWLGNAYEYRVTQALNGLSGENQLSAELIARLESMEKMDRYKVDRLRGLSRILEPHERINAFTRWHRRHADALEKQLSLLADETDREKLRATISKLLKSNKSSLKNHGRVLVTAIELAPRLGEDFANHLFDEVVTWLNKKVPTMEKANLLQKSLYVAAHFGRIDVVQSFVSLFQKSLSDIVAEYLALESNHNSANKEKVDAIESLFTESFRGLRKLGMREEIGRLYSGVEALIEEHEPKGKKKRLAKNTKTEIDSTRPLRLLLCVAGGYYYFGQQKPAEDIVKQVRKILLKDSLPSVEQKDLACAYVTCVSHAQIDAAIAMIQELFQTKGKKRTLANIKDNMTTSSHFSITQLQVVESTVLSLVSDDFSLDDESRRWLDEDEFLVRNKIHQDVRAAVK